MTLLPVWRVGYFSASMRYRVQWIIHRINGIDDHSFSFLERRACQTRWGGVFCSVTMLTLSLMTNREYPRFPKQARPPTS